ncbi:hypothetical protein GJV85_07770 [Sulfurimonas aquatica]|uniref:Lipoprotein n=1 Tax=Sulfurimonas aquatica TaxID=2672570 RepID=A0A975GD72_9BACT|nr:hypothetical protein [Sulfurimonas aquatica]QSZ42009.1 hypothetical protein GJV85_07770 [Sulfurimonas aquatica]
MIKKVVVGLGLVSMIALSGCSSYNEEFLKDTLKTDKLELVSFDIKSDESIEVMGQKGTKLVIDATYKTLEFTCEREVGNGKNKKFRIGMPLDKQYKTWDQETFYVKTEEECMKKYANARNQKVIDKPGAEVTKIRTVMFGEEDIIRWEAKQK